jgi:hypothetical protein
MRRDGLPDHVPGEGLQEGSGKARFFVDSQGGTMLFDDSSGHVRDEGQKEISGQKHVSVNAQGNVIEVDFEGDLVNSEEGEEELDYPQTTRALMSKRSDSTLEVEGEEDDEGEEESDSHDEGAEESDSHDQGERAGRRRRRRFSIRRRRRRAKILKKVKNGLKDVGDGLKDVVDGAKACLNDDFLECLKKAMDNSEAFKWVPSCGKDSCEKKVTDIAKNAFSKTWGRLKDEFTKAVAHFVQKIGSTPLSGAKTAIREAKGVVKAVKPEFTAVSSTIKTYIKKSPNYRKYNLGKLGSNRALWYMRPTDCGAFSSLERVFSEKAVSGNHFKDAASKLKRCISKTGLMNIPTPFMELRWQSFWLPQFVVTPFEYLLGAVIYGGDAGKDLAQRIEKLADILLDKVKEFKIGALLESGAPQQSIEGGGCGSEKSWYFEFGAVIGVEYEPPNNEGAWAFDIGIAAVNGCKNGRVVNPNIVLNLGYGKSIWPGENSGNKGKTNWPAKGDVRFFSSFGVEYPEFDMGNGRVAQDWSLEMVPAVKFTVIGVPLEGSVPINLIWTGTKDDVNDLKGYSFEVAGATEDGDLLEEGAANYENDTESGDPRLGPLAPAINSLFGAATSGQSLIDKAAYQASRVFSQRHSLMNRATAAMPSNQSQSTAFDFDVGASYTLSFCITVPKCFGQ